MLKYKQNASLDECKKNTKIKNIVCFVNRSSDECYEFFPPACEKLGLDLKIFNLSSGWTVIEDENDRPILIDRTGDVEFRFSEMTPDNTLIFPRVYSSYANLKNDDERKMCNGLEKLLADNNYMCINNLNAATLAQDKCACSLYCTEANLDQPRYIIFDKKTLNKCKDEEGTLIQEKFDEIVKTMYEDWDNEKSEEFTFVVKKPTGSLGIGVTLCKGNELLSTLQLILDCGCPQVLVQEMCKCDGGDLRIHVLNMGGEPKVISAMKRCKSTKDFRSNYSLGNDTESVELTDNQKRLAIEATKASGAAWTGIDVMHLEEPSIDGFEDVLIEINTSPGLSGISETTNDNIIEEILKAVLEGVEDGKDVVRPPFNMTNKSIITADGVDIVLNLSRINAKHSQLIVPYTYNNYFTDIIKIDGRNIVLSNIDITYSYDVEVPTLYLSMSDIINNKINLVMFDR